MQTYPKVRRGLRRAFLLALVGQCFFGWLGRAEAGWDDRFGLPGVHGWVSDMVVYRGELYIAGGFDFINSLPANNIAKWDGTNWSAVGGGLNGPVHDIVVGSDGIYVVGRFRKAGAVEVANIAKWNGDNWSIIGGQIGAHHGTGVIKSGRG